MNDQAALDANQLLAPEVLWELLPRSLPGRICRYIYSYPGMGGVEVLVRVRYPNGELMQEVYCKNLHDLPVDTFVLFDLVPAPEKDRRRKQQPDLMEAGSAIRVSREEIDAAIEKFVPAKATELARKLQQALDVVKKERAAVAASVEATVKERVAELEKAKRDLEARVPHLGEQETQIEQEVERRAQERVGQRLLQVSEQEESLKMREQRLDQATQELAQGWDQFRQEGGERFLAFLATLETTQGSDDLIEPLSDSSVPGNLIAHLRTGLTKHSYKVEESTLIQFLISVCVAASTGQFVILTGPTGVGKTSMATMMASALGAGWGVVPVRPAWIDPSDLLGFFHPAQNLFQPTPFMDRFLEAQRYAAANRLYLLTLDEMNLSRVENYAADFLSRLEKARSGEQDAYVSLYARELEQRQRAEINELCKRNSLDKLGRQRLSALMRHLDRYPAQIAIPEGLVLLGTINLDETAYSLSPRFRDRSFIVQIAHAALPDLISKTLASSSLTKPLWELSIATAKDLAREPDSPTKEADKIWNDLLQWQRDYLNPLGVRLGFRFPQMFRRYMTVGTRLGLKDRHLVASTFFQAKLLPWIDFHSDDDAIGRQGPKKLAVLEQWSQDGSLTAYSGLQSSMRRMIDRGGLVVQFLE